jgi:xylose isomerase
MAKIGVITGFLGRTRDRFHEYNEPQTLEGKLRMVSQMKGVDGLEVVYPYEANDATEFKALLRKYKLKVAAINVNVKAEPEFRNGGLTSSSKTVRDKAVRFIKEAKDFAKAVGADKVTCCPLGDGYEYHFQCDYAVAWNRLVETFGQAAAHRRDIPLFIEYKPSETRGKCFLDTCAKTLCLLNDIGEKALGITIDFGHATYGGENPAESVALTVHSGRPMYIHINDNDGLWDWDYPVATKHFLQYVEFLYYLRRYGYDGYLTSDTSPTRLDIRGTFETNARVTTKLWKKLAALEAKGLAKLVGAEDYLVTWRFIEKEILGL